MALTANLDRVGEDPAESLAVRGVAAPDAPADGPDPDRIELFSIDGRSYSIPRRPGPNIAIGYLRDVRRHGREYALAGLLEAMLGRDGLDALADYTDLTEEEMESVMTAVYARVLGPMREGGAGKR